MRIADSILAELEQEANTTRRVLERVPNEKLSWKPHSKSMSLGQLAHHVVVMDHIGLEAVGHSAQRPTRPRIPHIEHATGARDDRLIDHPIFEAERALAGRAGGGVGLDESARARNICRRRKTISRSGPAASSAATFLPARRWRPRATSG